MCRDSRENRGSRGDSPLRSDLRAARRTSDGPGAGEAPIARNCWNATDPREAHDRPPDRGDRARDVEDATEVSAQAHQSSGFAGKLTGPATAPASALEAPQISLAKKVERKHPCQRLIPAAAGDPTTRICPLAGPNEVMAREAPMEVWFTHGVIPGVLEGRREVGANGEPTADAQRRESE